MQGTVGIKIWGYDAIVGEFGIYDFKVINIKGREKIISVLLRNLYTIFNSKIIYFY